MFQPLEHEAIDGGATPTTRSGGSCADAEAICTCRTSANFTQIVRFRKMKSWRRFIKFPMKSTVKLSFKGSDHGFKIRLHLKIQKIALRGRILFHSNN